MWKTLPSTPELGQKCQWDNRAAWEGGSLGSSSDSPKSTFCAFQVAKPFSYPSCSFLSSGCKELKFTFNWDILNGKSKDDGPDHSKSHFNIAIHDFYGGKKIEKEIEGIKLQMQILAKEEHWTVFPCADGRIGIPAEFPFPRCSAGTAQSYPVEPSNQISSLAV